MDEVGGTKTSVKAVLALVLAVVSFLILPLAVFIEFGVLFLGSIDLAFQASESFLESAFIVLVICLFFVICLAPPIAAFLLAGSARRDIRAAAGALRGAGVALTALILTAVAMAFWLLGQVYLAALIAGFG